MKKIIKITWIFIFCSMVMLPSVLFAAPKAVGNAGPGLFRPETGLLYKTVYSGSSLMSKSSQKTIATLIQDIDRVHMQHLGDTKASYLGKKQFKKWVKTNSLQCHKLTPITERTLFSFLRLQIQILDTILGERNKELAEKLKKDRSMVRMRKKTEVCFGDTRDVFISIVIQHINYIADLQNALGVPGTIDPSFPKNAKSFEDIEKYVITNLALVKERALKIRI